MKLSAEEKQALLARLSKSMEESGVVEPTAGRESLLPQEFEGAADQFGRIRSAISSVLSNPQKRVWFTENVPGDESRREALVFKYLMRNERDTKTRSFFRTGANARAEDLVSDVLGASWASSVVNKSSNPVDHKLLSVSAFKGVLSDEFAEHLAVMSVRSDGARAAVSALEDAGLRFIPLRGPVGLIVDGMSFVGRWGEPVVAISFRYDRLDYFWFTLFHELAHVKLHLGTEVQQIIDNLEVENETEIEREANHVASNWLIPRSQWRRSAAFRGRDRGSIYEFAEKISRHPSIIAGRIRFENKDYTIHTDLIGQGELVRQFF